MFEKQDEIFSGGGGCKTVLSALLLKSTVTFTLV